MPNYTHVLVFEAADDTEAARQHDTLLNAALNVPELEGAVRDGAFTAREVLTDFDREWANNRMDTAGL